MTELLEPALAPAPTVFDVRAVRNLTGHAGDGAFAHVFVRRFRQLLPVRVRRIAAALHTHDLDEAMDAVLSLKTAAGTLGATELHQISARIEHHLRNLDPDAALVAASELPAAQQRADQALTAFLGGY
jgi:HPt (histidine-containing phosphotransfer) domain-containing protein